jgi:hypothetical protein
MPTTPRYALVICHIPTCANVGKTRILEQLARSFSLLKSMLKQQPTTLV